MILFAKFLHSKIAAEKYEKSDFGNFYEMAILIRITSAIKRDAYK